MKRVAQLIIISACCGLFIGAKSVEASRAGIFYFQQIPCAFSNLDARDGDNRSITVDAAMEKMVALFQDGLYDGLVNQEIPSIAAAQIALQKFLKYADVWFLPALRNCVENIVVLPQTVRRFMGHVLMPSARSSPGGGGPVWLVHPLSENNLIATPSLFSVMRC